jgi:glyoxylase-like metal-dependent hydrolase (beta-lactamase superfamily II)
VAGDARAARALLAPARGETWQSTPRAATQARAHEVAKGLWSLRLPLTYLAPAAVNCYLVALEDGWWLIDCGVELTSVRRLLCTHSHSDHAGLASLVIERSGCWYVRGSGPDAATDVLRDPSIGLEQRRASGRRAGIPEDELPGWVDNLLVGDCVHPRPVADQTVDDGDLLQSALGDWLVIDAQGHSPSQIVLFNAEKGWLIGADLAFPGISPYLECGWTEDPLADHLSALRRCSELDVSLLLPGHGRPDDAPRQRFLDARGAAERFAADVLARLGAAEQTAYDIAAELLDPGVDAEGCQAKLSTVICALEHFERLGTVSSRIDSAGVQRFARAAQAPAA